MSTANAKIRAQLKQATAAAPAPPPAAAEMAPQKEELGTARRRISELEAEVGRQEERWRASEAAMAELRATSVGLQEARDALQVGVTPFL